METINSSEGLQIKPGFENQESESKENIYELVAIDFASSDKQAMISKLMEQMRTVGFILIDNVPDFNEDELLKASKAFHNLPLEMKMKLALKHFNNETRNVYRGYFPFLDNDPSHKEFYDMSRPLKDISPWEAAGCAAYQMNPWFTDDDIKADCEATLGDLSQYDWIIDAFSANWKLMHDLALKLIGLIALGLDKPEDYFHGWFKEECTSTQRIIHYNPRDPAKEYKSKLVTPEHSDSGFITLLTTFGFPGLEVEIEGAYRPIKV